MKKLILIQILVIGLLTHSVVHSQTTLAAGDIAIVAYAMDNPDEIFFMSSVN